MPFSLVGWAEATPGNAAIVGVTRALLDTLFTGGAGDFNTMTDKINCLLGCWYGVASTPGYVRLKQASQKYSVVTIPGNDMEGGVLKPLWNDFKYRPIKLKPNEDVLAQTFNATDEATLIVAAVGNEPFKPPVGPIGEIFTLRGVVTQTLVALTWTPGAVVWSESLEEGNYKVLGMKAWAYKAANPGYTAVRLIGLKDTSWRPGCIAPTIAAAGTTTLQPYDENFSVWGEMPGIEFSNTAMPNVEMLSAYANTTELIELLLQKNPK